MPFSPITERHITFQQLLNQPATATWTSTPSPFSSSSICLEISIYTNSQIFGKSRASSPNTVSAKCRSATGPARRQLPAPAYHRLPRVARALHSTSPTPLSSNERPPRQPRHHLSANQHATRQQAPEFIQ
ncbi:hypothetical protein Sjap_004726 [Stephania japonica]|uniref:Uncharacterized protein n=1 Tax=Stephania japonica TaxID=461633 RepID=A0AAP0K2Q7_9MAGN